MFNAIKPLDIKYCGQSCVEKVDAVRQFIKGRADAYAVTSLDEIAWLLNFRGSDIPFNPVSFAYLIVSSGNIDLFVDKSAVGDDLKEHLLPLGVNYHDYSDIFSFKHSFKV